MSMTFLFYSASTMGTASFLLKKLTMAPCRALLTMTAWGPFFHILVWKSIHKNVDICVKEQQPAPLVPKGVQREQLANFGAYIAQVLPKYVQLVQVTDQNELEICIHPAGIRPVHSFLKDHSLARFESMSDMTAVDIPNR